MSLNSHFTLHETNRSIQLCCWNSVCNALAFCPAHMPISQCECVVPMAFLSFTLYTFLWSCHLETEKVSIKKCVFKNFPCWRTYSKRTIKREIDIRTEVNARKRFPFAAKRWRRRRGYSTSNPKGRAKHISYAIEYSDVSTSHLLPISIIHPWHNGIERTKWRIEANDT